MLRESGSGAEDQFGIADSLGDIRRDQRKLRVMTAFRILDGDA